MEQDLTFLSFDFLNCKVVKDPPSSAAYGVQELVFTKRQAQLLTEITEQIMVVGAEATAAAQ